MKSANGLRSLDTQPIETLSPDWFKIQHERVLDATSREYLGLLEACASTPALPDEAEIMKHYTCDPHCKSCHGRGRLGINRIPATAKSGAFYQLQLCHCAKPAESDILRLEKMLQSEFRHIHSADMQFFQSLYRNTFYGGLVYRYNVTRSGVKKRYAAIKKSIVDRWASIKKSIVDRWVAWEQRRIKAKEATNAAD